NDLQDPRRLGYYAPNLRNTLGDVSEVSTTGDITTITFADALANEPVIGNYAFIETSDPNDPTLVGLITGFGSNTIEITGIINTPVEGASLTYVEYIGGGIGEISTYGNHTHVADRMVDPSEPGVLLSYTEVQFLLAEAAARGYSVGGDAESHYNEGIRASFNYWNAEGVEDYLAKPEVAYNSALAMSSSNPAWKEVIGTQAYLGLYNRTFASYLSVRRVDYRIFADPTDAVSGFPTRYTYPVGEQTLNGTNWAAASSAIGGDVPETRLFWDLFYTFPF